MARKASSFGSKGNRLRIRKSARIVSPPTRPPTTAKTQNSSTCALIMVVYTAPCWTESNHR